MNLFILPWLSFIISLNDHHKSVQSSLSLNYINTCIQTFPITIIKILLMFVLQQLNVWIILFIRYACFNQVHIINMRTCGLKEIKLKCFQTSIRTQFLLIYLNRGLYQLQKKSSWSSNMWKSTKRKSWIEIIVNFAFILNVQNVFNNLRHTQH